MSDLEKRISRLEKGSGDTEVKPWLVVVYGETEKPSEAKLEKAKAEYRKEHPDWQEQDFNVIWVTSEDAKKNTERVMAGEGTE